MMTAYHKPVMCSEAIAGLAIRPNGVYVDVTFGGGGHSRAILAKLNEDGRLLAFDQDADAAQNQIEDPRFTLIQANFSHLKRFLKFYQIEQVDGVLADFGVSSYQFDTADRGFSTRMEGPLDMRMNTSQPLDAATVVNTYDVKALQKIFRLYGELTNAKAIADALYLARQQQPLVTTTDLVGVLQPFFPGHILNKRVAQVFQALRIEVNQELEVLVSFLAQSTEILKPQGRLVCIAYHSLEDRLVKRYVRDGCFEGESATDLYGRKKVPFKAVGKLIVPSSKEIHLNNRARSAKLRIAERL